MPSSTSPEEAVSGPAPPADAESRRSPGRLRSPAYVVRSRSIRVSFAGRPVTALEGETVAAALTAAGIRTLRTNERGEPRGVFCGMGVCFDCLVRIDGKAGQRACMTKVAEGMRIQPDAGPVVHPGEPPAPLASLETPIVEDATDAVLVIGAGPGGLAAAEAAAAAGARVIVLDERPEPGGQYYKQLAPSHGFADAGGADRQYADGRALIERVRRAGVRIASGATVWGALPDPGVDGFDVGAVREGRAMRFLTRRIVVAAGACEIAHPVPGWTLPGVMTTGAAQTLMRAYRVAPGSRVLVAGNGPLNLQVAWELARNGVDVAAVAEAAAGPGLRHAGAALRAAASAPDLVLDGLRYLRDLKRRGIPILYGHAMVRAEGAGALERAVLARLDGAGRPVSGSERTFDVDTACLGYGFASSTELTRLLGCRHEYRPGPFPGLAPVRDANGATTRSGVFVAGDCGEFGGARVALAQGTLAGVEAARRLGCLSDDDAAARGAAARRALARGLAFQRALWRLFRAPPPDAMVTPEAVICRCEGVTAGAVRSRIANGDGEAGALKRSTRAGMGRCQGRYCAGTIARDCASAADRGPDERDWFAPRYPVKPVPALALAKEAPEWREAQEGMSPPPPAAPVARSEPSIEREAGVVVIGAGIVGSCAAWHLARDGADVVVLERGRRNGAASGNNAGSLHVQLLAYDFGDRAQAGGQPAARTLPLQRESAAAWPAFAETLGVDLGIEITGGLMLAEDARRLEYLARKAAVERRQGVEVRILSGSELRDLAPYVSCRMAGAAWCPAEGRINPLLAAPAVLDGALAAGARLYEDAEVLSVERSGAGFEIRTARGTIRAGKVLNACGGWSARIAGMVGGRLPARAHPIQLIVTEPVPPLVRHLLSHADRHLTLKQVRNGNLVIGGGWRAALDADSGFPTVRRDSLEGNLWVASQVLPGLDAMHVIRSWAAMNVAIDGAPLLGELPGVPGFFHAITVNGITLGPLLGQLMAEWMRTGRAPPGTGYFTLDRFG